MGQKIFKWTILGIGILLLLYQFVFFARETTKVYRWGKSGSTGLSIEQDSVDTPYYFAELDTAWFTEPPYPALKDTILSLSDSLARHDLKSFSENPVLEVGEKINFSYLHEGVEQTSTLITKAREKDEVTYVSIIQVLRFLIAVGYMFVGLWAFLKRPDSGGVRSLALFSFAMVSFMMVAVNVASERYASFEIPGYNTINEVCGYLAFLFGAFLLNLLLLFPHPVNFIKNHKWLAHILIYLPQAIWIIAELIIDSMGIELTQIQPLQYIPFLIISAQVAIGFIVLGFRRSRIKEPLEKRQISIVLYGSGIGLGLIFALILMSATGLLGTLPDTAQILLINFVFLALLLSPLSFAYAFGRYRLLEVEGSLRRGTRYVLVTSILLVAFFTLLYGISGLLLNTLNIANRTPTLAIALLLALGFAPVHRRVQRTVEAKFYPERRRLRELLSEFLASTASMPDRATLWSSLEENLKQGLNVSNVIPLETDEEKQKFRLQDGDWVPVDLDSALVQQLEQKNRPLVVDEVVASGKVSLASKEREWLEERNINLLLPMVVNSRLTGLLAIGFKKDQDGFSGEDLDVLISLASQVALQTENLRLQEENFEKKRLEEQLDMARQVQQRFLPNELPDTPGLEVSACCLASLEVAGDYYDVISLPENRTALVVGDVSGKGAGAAMLMANLQASLRTALQLKGLLAEVTEQINDLIFDNTAPEEYITFFAAVYSADESRLDYVNAGHNAPRLVRENGKVELLEEGGPILDAIPNFPYTQGSLTLNKGDLLVAFTDGASEAMNEHEEEFGEDRIENIACENRTESTAQIMENLQSDIDVFRGDVPLGDDFTILIASVNSG